MAIKMRTGLEADFYPSEMIPGEWAVSTDTRYVRMCFAAGVVVRMATYDAFESDMAKIQAILEEVCSVQDAVERIKNEVNDTAIVVENYVEAAKEYSDLSSTYAMQSKQSAEEASGYADDAYEEAERAKMYAENASAVTEVEIATQDRAGIIKGGENYISEDGTLQLTKQTTDTTLYNSYEGGIRINEIGGASEQGASPSPDYPQEIKSVVISEIKTVGKNLLQNTAATQSINGIDFTVNEDGSIIANGTATSNAIIVVASKLALENGKKYILTGCPAGGTLSTYRLQGYKVTKASSNAVPEYGEGLMFVYDDSMVDVGVESNNIALVVSKGYTANNLIFYPMIRKADIEDATYEPYKESVITLSDPITLNGINDVKDRIVRKDGVWGVERKFHEVVFDGSDDENIVSETNEIIRYRLRCDGNVLQCDTTHNIAMCNRLILAPQGDTYRPSTPNNIFTVANNYIYVKTNGTDALAEFKAKLAGQPLKFIIPLVVPTFKPLPDADQIALNSLVSFDTVTYLFCDSEIEPVIGVEYGTSKVGGLTLDAQNKYDVGKFIVDKYAVKENTQLHGRVLIRNLENPNNVSAFNMTTYGDNDTIGIYAAAFGFSVSARGSYSFAHGSSGQSNGVASAVIAADEAVANGNFTLATGTGTRALSRTQFVSGKYNVEDTAERYAYIIGNGTNDKKRSNAFTVDWDGNIECSGMLKGQLPYRASYLQVSNWQVSTEYDGFGYTQEVSLDGYYDRYPEYFLKTLSNGIVPTEAEKTAFELISAMKLDTSDIEHPKLIFYATDKPSTALLVIVKGVL